MMTIVVVVGLAVRFWPGLFPREIASYLGDILWSMTVFMAWAFMLPGKSTPHIAQISLATALLIEFSQLYQADWINAVRKTIPGYLILGTTFSWGDLPGYAVGIALAAWLDSLRAKYKNRGCKP